MSTSTLSLTEAHAQQLASSAIAEQIIVARGYRSIAPGAAQEVRELTGGSFSRDLLRRILHQGALAFPIYRLGDAKPHAWVLRPDLPRSADDGKPIKYEYPRAVGNVFDVLPSYQAALSDPTIPLWLTEGAKKADALASAYGAAIVPVNLNGVYGWRGRGDKGGKAALPDFDLITWEGRQVVIAPDGDVKENRNVAHAVARLGRLLTARYGVAELLVCYLPQQRGAPKIGVDDYLATGHTASDLEQHLVELGAAASGARIPMGTHPETGEKLLLPAGYDVRDQTIYRVDEQGRAQRIYSGAIFVTETGEDLQTREHTDTIRWNGRGTHHGEITIPHDALSDSKAFSGRVGKAGAALGPKSIKDVMQFLVEFVQENREALPHRAHADKLGLAGSGLVLPAGAVGFAEPVRYIGSPTVRVGQDAGAYGKAIGAMLDWNDAAVAWLALGLSLAAPAIARLKLRRNPVLYLSGASGSGKTTLAQFATGCWGDPTRHPLRVEAGRTTPAGIFQTLESLGGLPALVDEAHTVVDPKRLELASYSFANGQRYTVGGVDGKARGGEALSGTLFLAGEALPDFKHAGSRLRVLWVDAGVHLPLGAEARTPEGAARAQQLERAWDAGAGLFGLVVAERMWGDWADFTGTVQKLETHAALAPLGPWREPLAAAAAALRVAFLGLDLLGALPGGSTWVHQLLERWAQILTSGQHEVDPASDAWERLVTMLAQGHRRNDGDTSDVTRLPIPGSASWEFIEADHGGGVIACRKPGEDVWRVLTSTPQFRDRVGDTAVQLYGQTWLKRGLVLPGSDGKATEVARIYPAGRVRVLKVPQAALDGERV
jgi:energy-coupling factor transporter ATP-binding protein EcfA2